MKRWAMATPYWMPLLDRISGPPKSPNTKYTNYLTILRNAKWSNFVLPESPGPKFFLDEIEQISLASDILFIVSTTQESQDIAWNVPCRTSPSAGSSSTCLPRPIAYTLSSESMPSQFCGSRTGRMVWLNRIGCGNLIRPWSLYGEVQKLVTFLEIINLDSSLLIETLTDIIVTPIYICWMIVLVRSSDNYIHFVGIIWANAQTHL